MGKGSNNFIKDILPLLHIGDIIYAYRYDNEKEKNLMRQGHDSGPYVVIGFDNKKVIGAPLTSSENERKSIQVANDMKIFSRNKNSYMSLSKIKTIDSKSFINMAHKRLNNDDLKKIKKIINFNNIHYSDRGKKKSLTRKFNLYFEEGDIAFIKSDIGLIGIVLSKMKDNKYVLVPSNGYKRNTNYINLSQIKIDYSNTKEVEENSLHYLNTLNRQQFSIIKKNYYQYLKDSIESNKKEINKNKTGTVIYIKNNEEEKYLIVDEKKDTYVIVSLHDLILNNNLKYKEISKNSIIPVKDLTIKELNTIKKVLEQISITNKKKSRYKKIK